MKLKKNIAASESGFIFNPTSGDSFSTNDMGAELITLMQEGKSYEEIRNTVMLKFDVSEIIFERDWTDFISQLKDFKLVETESQ